MAKRTGTSGDDTLNGTTGDDVFYGLGGDDMMYGGYGNDRFMGGEGEDYMFGGAGVDTVDYSNVQGGVTINLMDGWGSEWEDNDTDYYSSIENATGTNDGDNIYGDDSANHIRGLDGRDWIKGGGGADTLEGGAGVDILVYEDSDARVVIDLQANTASGGDATGDVISGFEDVYGSAYNDILSGTSGANYLYGADGNDTLNGRGGDDIIVGEEGNDVMTGGSGADTFSFYGIADTGVDRITDFNVHQDTIRYDFLNDADAVGASATYTVGGYDWLTGTIDVTVHFGDEEGDAVILENLAIADVAYLDSAIEFV
jgi:Ca2+-binding RTX toxin-like protein